MKPTLHDLQLCELEILKQVDRICEENNIPYFLSSGTLLGAVRHRGFIPWDDDIDIEMFYPDYKRFVALSQEVFGEDLFLQDRYTDPAFNGMYAKVRKNHTTMLNVFERGTNGHHGVWIDIFPVISVGGSFDISIRKKCLRICNLFLMERSYFEADKKYIRGITNGLEFQFVRLITRLPHKIRNGFCSLFARVVFRRPNRRTEKKAIIWSRMNDIVPTEIYQGEKTKLLFEDKEFPVPPKYKEYLTVLYNDYMQLPPEDQRNGGHGELIIDLEHGWEELSEQEP